MSHETQPNDVNENDNRIKEAETRIRESEARLKEIEANLRQRELDTLKSNSPHPWKTTLSTLTVPLVLALVALIGSVIGSMIQGSNNLEIEREKFRFAMIQKVTESSPENQLPRIEFLIEAGVISDPNEKIRNLARNNKIPVFSSLNTTPIIGEGWIFLGTYEGAKWTHPTVNIKNDHIPKAGDTYTVIDDVYLRADAPTGDNQLSSIIKTVSKDSSVQILKDCTVIASKNYWCRVSLATSGDTTRGNSITESNMESKVK